jgi:histidine ammonia-lyase
MTVELTGKRLNLDEVVRVARNGEQVAIAAAALEHMREARAVVERAVAKGSRVYGLTTGVGMRRDAAVAAEEAAAFNRSAIAGHLVGLGPPAPRDVVRASLLRLANSLVAGYQGVRPELAERIVSVMNDGPEPVVRSLGTLGEADLAQNADLAHGALADFALAAGEAGALLATNAFSTGQAALAVADARAFADILDAAAALDFEAFRGNISVLHPSVVEARPHPGTRDTLAGLREQLEGSGLWDEGAARFLQDPLSFRCVPQLHGALRDALAYVDATLAVELNAHQGNPLVVVSGDEIVSVGNFESAQLSAALDFLRIALAPVLTAAVERTLKLISPRFSGLSEGLTATEGTWEDGLSELGVAAQAIVAEARLLAQPVSFELASTMQESGVEDRTTLTSLGARRLAEMLDLGARIVAIELVVAAQAVDLRDGPKLGVGAAATHAFVRARVPFLDSPDRMPLPLEELATELRSNALPA